MIFEMVQDLVRSKYSCGFPMVETEQSAKPPLFDDRVRRVALQDFLAREVRDAIPRAPRRGTGKSGLVTIDAGAQEVLERTALVVTEDWVEARIEVGLPGAGRTILGKEAESILVRQLPVRRR